MEPGRRWQTLRAAGRMICINHCRTVTWFTKNNGGGKKIYGSRLELGVKSGNMSLSMLPAHDGQESPLNEPMRAPALYKCRSFFCRGYSPKKVPPLLLQPPTLLKTKRAAVFDRGSFFL